MPRVVGGRTVRHHYNRVAPCILMTVIHLSQRIWRCLSLNSSVLMTSQCVAGIGMSLTYPLSDGPIRTEYQITLWHINGDSVSQWKIGKFDPHSPKKP